MNGPGHFLPGVYLFLSVDTRRQGTADGLFADVNGFGEDESGTYALGIVLHGHIAYYAMLIGSASGHGRHDYAIF